ncbi:MAG: 50S ribosomal protein L20 [Bryobacterales bacterium]|nr:50S ribosomal protein L20 [Bryobacterales bacterium]
MPRVKRGTKRRASRAKTLERASGYFLTKSKLHRSAQEAVEKALRYGYVGRKRKKREFRSLWIVRIGAACREAGISYSRFMDGLKKSGIELNRKILADLALNDAGGFRSLVEKAKGAIPEAS